MKIDMFWGLGYLRMIVKLEILYQICQLGRPSMLSILQLHV